MFGLFGLFGLFSFVPLEGYGLFAALSGFFLAFYAVGIPMYMLTKLVKYGKNQTATNPYQFLTDRMSPEYSA